MPEPVARIVTLAVGVYLGAGLLFAVPFVMRGVDRIDDVAAASGWGFRLTILPGCVALWPVLLARWLRRAAPPEERNAHRNAAREGR